MSNINYPHIFYTSATSGYMINYEKCAEDGCVVVRIWLEYPKPDWYYYENYDKNKIKTCIQCKNTVECEILNCYRCINHHVIEHKLG